MLLSQKISADMGSSIQLQYVCKTKFSYIIKYKWRIISKRWVCYTTKFTYTIGSTLNIKVFYGLEPPSGESTTTECGFNYQLLAVICWSSPNWEHLGAVDHNQLRTMASETVDPIDWSHPPPYTGQSPLSSTYCTVQCGLQITTLTALAETRTCDLRNERPTHCLCGHSGYKLPKQRTYGDEADGNWWLKILHSWFN